MRKTPATVTRAAIVSAALIAGLAACSGGERREAADTTTASATVPAQSAAPSAAIGARLAVAEKSGIGRYVTDAKGRSVYLFLKDIGDSSSCYDACAAAWPPLLSTGGTVAGDIAVRTDLLGMSQRRDGATQVTYEGAPLYYYEDDKQPGDITGQGKEEFGGKWYLVSPAGGKQGGP